VDVRIWKEEAMIEVLFGHLARGNEKITKSRITDVSAEVQTDHLPNSIKIVVKLLVKVKVKCILVQALRLCTGRTVHRESRGIALLFHDQRH
jgi:hypothetical protein